MKLFVSDRRLSVCCLYSDCGALKADQWAIVVIYIVVNGCSQLAATMTAAVRDRGRFTANLNTFG